MRACEIPKDPERSPRSSLMKQGGWAPLPSWVFESNHLIDPIQNKILLFIAWKNLSRKDPDYRFSVRYLASRTGLKRSTVHRYLKLMKLAGLLVEKGRGPRNTLLLDISPRNPFVQAESDSQELSSISRIPIRPGKPGQSSSRLPGQVQHNNSTTYNSKSDISFLQFLKGKISPNSIERIKENLSILDDQLVLPENLPRYLRITVGDLFLDFLEKIGNDLSPSSGKRIVPQVV